MDLSKVAVIIPSLNPDQKLIGVYQDIAALPFAKIVIVNDGSDEKHAFYFDEIKGDNVIHLTHEVNRGKGAALKTAFSYVTQNLPDIAGVVTVDGDGQHKREDIVACVKELDESRIILGARDFSLSNVPKRSAFGNKLTSLVFKLCCGLNITDTQTGLRAIPSRYLSLLLNVPGDRFEYETNMLLEMKTREIPYSEVKINTVYIEENRSSHFHPVKDSFRIYKLLLKFIASSMASFLIDALVFLVLGLILPEGTPFRILIQTAVARAISSICNFTINKKMVFSSKNGTGKAVLKYYALCIPQMLISAGLVSLIIKPFILSAFGETLIKILVDTVLFLISFQIQREWVFKKKQ